MDPENKVRLSENEADDALRNIKTLRKQDFNEVKNVLELAEKDAKKGNAEVSFFCKKHLHQVVYTYFNIRK